jgi:hypothetical protein
MQSLICAILAVIVLVALAFEQGRTFERGARPRKRTRDQRAARKLFPRF